MLIFIGSSTEAAQGDNSPVAVVARWIEEHGHMALRWDDVGAFSPGSYVLPRLLEISSDVDASVFIYGPDDQVWYRGDLTSRPRDNVFIEIGAFSHALGVNRTILCLSGDPRIASDLHGLVNLRLDDALAEDRFKSWLDLVVSTPKAAYVVDENASLRLALADIVWRRGKKKRRRKRKKVSLLSIIDDVVAKRQMIDWTFVSARQLMKWIEDDFKKHAEDAYWWLIVYGAFRFRNIDQFFDNDDEWRNSVDYAVISERGKAFFMHLQRRRQHLHWR